MAKVLLVEDDNNLREIYEARLLAEGYDIVTAKDGEDALAAAKQSKPDLIISDVMMPRISGFEMLDILRNTEGLKNVKIVMLTALGQADDRERAQNMGADRYLVKSQVTLEDIVKTAEELLDPDYVPPSEETEAAPEQGTAEAQANIPGVTPVAFDSNTATATTAVNSQTPITEPTEPATPPAQTPPATQLPEQPVTPDATTQPVAPQPIANVQDPSPVQQPANEAVAQPVAETTQTTQAPQPIIQSFGEPVMPTTTQPSTPLAPELDTTTANVVASDSTVQPDSDSTPAPDPVQPTTPASDFMTPQASQPPLNAQADSTAAQPTFQPEAPESNASEPQAPANQQEVAIASTPSEVTADSNQPAENQQPELTLPSIGGFSSPTDTPVVDAPETPYADPTEEHPHMPANSEETVAADAQTTAEESATIGQQINNFVENEEIPQIRIDDSVNEPTMVTVPPDDNGPDEDVTPDAADEREELISSALNELLSSEESQPTEVLADPTPTQDDSSAQAPAPVQEQPGTAETQSPSADVSNTQAAAEPVTAPTSQPTPSAQPAEDQPAHEEATNASTETVTPQAYTPETVTPQAIAPDPTPQPEAPTQQPSVSQIPGKKVIQPLGLPDDHKHINDLIAQEEIKENLEKGTTGAAIVSGNQQSEPGVTQVPPQVTTQPTVPGGVFVPNSDGSAQDNAL